MDRISKELLDPMIKMDSPLDSIPMRSFKPFSLGLEVVLEEVGHPYHEAVWMVSLMIEQFRTELGWLKRVAREMKKRGRAKHPEYAS